jgi:hypothetical protein
MATYIDPTAATSGAGTEGDPLNTWVGITYVDDGEYLQKAGTVWKGILPEVPAGVDGVTIGSYGTGPKPIVRSVQTLTDWTQVGATNVYSKSGLGDVGATCFIDGEFVPYVDWDTDEATTAALMTPFTCSFDWVNKIAYVYVASGLPSDYTIEWSMSKFCYFGNEAVDRLTFKGLRFEGANRSALQFESHTNCIIEDCEFEYQGADRRGESLIGGNHVTVGPLSHNCTVRRCWFGPKVVDIGLSYETYLTDKAIIGGLAELNVFEKIRDGIQVRVTPSAVGSGSGISGVTIRKNTIRRLIPDTSPVGTYSIGITCGSDITAATVNDLRIENNDLEIGDNTGSTGTAIFVRNPQGKVTVKGNTIRMSVERPTTVSIALIQNGSFANSEFVVDSNTIVGRTTNSPLQVRLNGGTAAIKFNSFIQDPQSANNGCVYFDDETSTGGTVAIDNNYFSAGYRWGINKESGTVTTVTASKNGYGVWGSPVNLNVTDSGAVTITDPHLSTSYRPLPGSPLIGAGTHLGYTTDLDGKQRFNPPSIGAFEPLRSRIERI